LESKAGAGTRLDIVIYLRPEATDETGPQGEKPEEPA